MDAYTIALAATCFAFLPRPQNLLVLGDGREKDRSTAEAVVDLAGTECQPDRLAELRHARASR